MQHSIGWRVYYADGSRFSHEDGAWTDAPYDQVQVVVDLFPEHLATFYSGGDWYWRADGIIRYVPSLEWGTWQGKPDCSCTSCVKRGTGVPDHVFRDIIARAYGDL